MSGRPQVQDWQMKTNSFSSAILSSHAPGPNLWGNEAIQANGGVVGFAVFLYVAASIGFLSLFLTDFLDGLGG